jgi:hypothetical protein
MDFELDQLLSQVGEQFPELAELAAPAAIAVAVAEPAPPILPAVESVVSPLDESAAIDAAILARLGVVEWAEEAPTPPAAIDAAIDEVIASPAPPPRRIDAQWMGRDLDISHRAMADAKAFEEMWLNTDLVVFPRVTIAGGQRSIPIDWSDMGLSPQLQQALKDAEARSSNIKVNSQLNTGIGRLERLRGRFYMGMSQVGGQWAAPAEQYVERCNLLGELMDAHEKLSNEIRDGYEKHREQTFEKIGNVFRKARMTEAEADARLTKIQSIYPTADQVLAGFRVEIDPPRFVPRLADRATVSAEMLEARIREAAAESSVAEFRIIERVRKQAEQTMVAAYTSAAKDYEKQIAKQINLVIKTMLQKGVKPGKLTKAMSASLTKKLRDLKLMADTPWSGSLQDNVEAVTRMADRLRTDRTAKIEDVREELGELLSQLVPVEEFIADVDDNAQAVRLDFD